MTTAFDLFDSMVVPIVIHAAEIWGYEMYEKIEQYCKFIPYVFHKIDVITLFLVNVVDTRYPLFIYGIHTLPRVI